MYGLVNNGVRTFIVTHHGEETWRQICKTAGVSEDAFDNMQAYDDAITYALVGAVSKTLGLSSDQVLEVFGEYWVGFAKSTALGKLMDHQGEAFLERLRGLDEMHERIQITMPHLNPPSFEFEERPDGNHRLHYVSSRQGLAPMVVGLLHGLAAESGVSVDVTQCESREDGAAHDVFALRILSTSVSAA